MLHKFRFFREFKDGSIEYKYKLTRLAAVRAYKKESRDCDPQVVTTFGWETFEGEHRHFGREAWLDADNIVPVR